MKKLLWGIPALLLSVLIATPNARADSLTYTISGLSSGTLDGTSFINALVTFSVTGNTSAIVSPQSGTYILAAPMSVSVAGVGTDMLTGITGVEDVQNGGDHGVASVSVNNLVMFAIGNTPAFQTYDLSTPIGPISSSTSIHVPPPIDFNTSSSGTFYLSGLPEDPVVTFEASETPGAGAAAPEPAPALLLLLGAGLIVFMRKRFVMRLPRTA